MAEIAIHRRDEEAARRRSLITPEGVDLSLRLADVGQRISAFLVDFILIFVTLILLVILASAAAATLGLAGFQVAMIFMLLGYFLLRNGYFILLEMGPRAATLGKRMAGLRVVARSGERLTADRVIARNLMREIEFYLPLTFLFYDASAGTADALTALAGTIWAGLFLFFPLFNKDRMRVGDLLAGTWVVSAPRKKLSVDLAPAGAWEGSPEYRFTDAQLDVYGVFELQTLEQVLRDAHPEATATVAEAIRVKIGMASEYGHDLAFLTAYYDAARARMERGLLFGKRRADKFDKPA